MENDLDHIQQQALKDLETAANGQDVQNISVRYLGRKGVLTQFLRNISKLPAQQRPAAGKKANEVKNILDEIFKTAAEKFELGGIKDTSIDVSLPGRVLACGALHPVTQTNQQICDIFSNLGFDIAEGPEVESDYYNFEALNFPKDHPARDM
ncbi:MAG: phenylalanine--tRNA ligase subunit alpha, partial [Desulfobacterales bacterium]|nr:phenylalanine--tRNA ligase subunit alpha [Desulfobacterales bacterium]